MKRLNTNGCIPTACPQLTDDSLLVGLVAGLAVLLHVGAVEEGQLAQGALLVLVPRLVLAQVRVVGLRLAPAVGHELDVEDAQTVQAQHVVRAVVFLRKGRKMNFLD